jgi:hypothetical protein
MTLIIPNTFQNREISTPLSDLDDNFTYLKTAIETGAGGAINFDCGTPTTSFATTTLKLDCGGIA